MELCARYAFFAGAAWAAVGLVIQLVVARGGGRTDHSRPAGSPAGGVIYNFTVAMMPNHKETVGKHPLKFLLGVLTHLGMFAAFACLVIGMLRVSLPSCAVYAIDGVLGLGLAAGFWLFLRRVISKTLRAISAPDDFIAILATCGLMAAALLVNFGRLPPAYALFYAAGVLVYMPLGKLRHCAFFFAARANLGAKLGTRGVYPPQA